MRLWKELKEYEKTTDHAIIAYGVLPHGCLLLTELLKFNFFLFVLILGFKPLKCKYCFRPFGDPSNLNKHIRLHTQTTDHHHHHLHTNSSSENQAAYRCHICSKNLLKRRDLIRHMQLSHSSASTNGSSNISENQSSGQEDSQMTLRYSPALSSPISSTSNEDDEEAEVVDWLNCVNNYEFFQETYLLIFYENKYT